MTTSIWQADDTQPIREVDVLVVGAGIVGSAGAYFAQQAGHDVVVIDKHQVADGASGRNAGFMITGLDSYYHRAVERYGQQVTREMWDLSRKTIAYCWEFIANSPFSVQHDPCGSLLLAETPKEAQDLRLAAHLLEAEGIGIIFHETDPLNRGYHAAIEQPDDGAVNPVQLTQSILEQSEAEFIPNNALYRIEQTDEETVTVHTEQFIFQANYVLLCTNAYSPLIDPYFIDKITPTRAQCLVTEPLDEPVLTTCGYSDYGYMYYRSTFDNRFLLGGKRNAYRELESDTTEDRLCEPVQSALDSYLRQYFPDVTAPISRRWAGIMGFSVDGLPLVGTLPNQPRIGFAVGFTGHGLALGIGTAERAVDKLLNETYAGAVDVKRFEN